MKAHIARNQNAGVPMVLGWNPAPGARGILDGMADAFGMTERLVSPDAAGPAVAQQPGEAPPAAARPPRLGRGAFPPAILLPNFRPRAAATLLDLLNNAKAQIPLRAVGTPSNRQWVFGDLLAQLLAEAAPQQKGQVPAL